MDKRDPLCTIMSELDGRKPVARLDRSIVIVRWRKVGIGDVAERWDENRRGEKSKGNRWTRRRSLRAEKEKK